jgi:hypothetical protein
MFRIPQFRFRYASLAIVLCLLLLLRTFTKASAEEQTQDASGVSRDASDAFKDPFEGIEVHGHLPENEMKAAEGDPEVIGIEGLEKNRVGSKDDDSEERTFVSEQFEAEPFEILVEMNDEDDLERMDRLEREDNGLSATATKEMSSSERSVVTITETVTVDRESTLPMRSASETVATAVPEPPDTSDNGSFSLLLGPILASLTTLPPLILLIFLFWYALYYFIFRHNYAVQEIFGLPRTDRTELPESEKRGGLKKGRRGGRSVSFEAGKEVKDGKAVKVE